MLLGIEHQEEPRSGRLILGTKRNYEYREDTDLDTQDATRRKAATVRVEAESTKGTPVLDTPAAKP